MFGIKLVSDTSMGNYIDGLVADSSITHEKALQNLRNNILTSVETKFVTYMRLNPSLTVHDVYKPCVNYMGLLNISYLILSYLIYQKMKG